MFHLGGRQGAIEGDPDAALGILGLCDGSRSPDEIAECADVPPADVTALLGALAHGEVGRTLRERDAAHEELVSLRAELQALVATRRWKLAGLIARPLDLARSARDRRRGGASDQV